MKEEIRDVQFRKFKGEIIAVFPYVIENGTNVMSYQHVGQHSGCAWDINENSVPAKPKEYEPLKKEMEKMGYVLNVIKRRSHKKYLRAYWLFRLEQEYWKN